LLAASRDGATEAIILAHGFAVEQMVELVRTGLATATAGRVVTGGRAKEVAPVRDRRGEAPATKQPIGKMPREWNTFWYWREKAVQERVNAANILEAAGVQIVEILIEEIACGGRFGLMSMTSIDDRGDHALHESGG